MPAYIDGEKFYRISEACTLAGISRVTFLRWIREGRYQDVLNRDWRGWRLFTDADIAELKRKVGRINKDSNRSKIVQHSFS